MKISTNTIGNYSPHINNNSVQRTKAASEVKKTEPKIEIKSKGSDLTSDEKNFFINMYPKNKSEITDYHFYQKNGEMSGVKVGSLFDGRG